MDLDTARTLGEVIGGCLFVGGIYKFEKLFTLLRVLVNAIEYSENYEVGLKEYVYLNAKENNCEKILDQLLKDMGFMK